MNDDTAARSREDAFFELSFSPNVELVTTVRKFVGEFYVEILKDADVTDRLAVATHELLENAVRYSVDGNTMIRIGITRSDREVDVVITTRNRAQRENVAVLRQTLDEVASAEDPVAFYQSLMRRSAKRKEGSGLGLGRVRAEAEMSLAYDIDDDTVCLRAQARYETRAA